MSTKDIDDLMEFPNIVHNRKKLEAIVSQAQGYFEIEKDFGSFSNFLWSYVNHQPIDLNYTTASERITVDDRAKQLSKDLKNMVLNFRTSNCFFILEAAGLYDAHLKGCPSKPS